MIYAFVDTNIWLRVISQGKPGCELAHLAELRRLVDEDQITLLVPEIVVLELEKQWRAFTDDVKRKVGQLEQGIEKLIRQKIWTEIDDIQEAVLPFLTERRDHKNQGG